MTEITLFLHGPDFTPARWWSNQCVGNMDTKHRLSQLPTQQLRTAPVVPMCPSGIIDHYEEILAPGLQFDSQARSSVRPQEGSMSPYSGSGLRRKQMHALSSTTHSIVACDLQRDCILSPALLFTQLGSLTL